MKTKGEPAEPLLRKHPAVETDLQKEGFLSALYVPKGDTYPGKVLVLVGGSDGYFSLTRLIAEQFVGRGLTVLALAYWAKEGLPTAMSHIPLEYAEKAALWLKNRGYEKIGICGVSMGSVYAMLAASYLPELYSCAVAISPMCICPQGIQKKNAWHKKMQVLSGSSCSFRGEDIPFAPVSFRKKVVLRDSFRRKEICLHSCYEEAVRDEKAFIPVENMSGPLLLLAADSDSMWPSRQAGEKLLERMEKAGKQAEFYHYAYASHLLLPYKLKSTRMFRMERKFPERCWQSDLDSFQKTLTFLRNNW